MANTYIRINFPISATLKQMILQQTGVLGIILENNWGIVFETSLNAQNAQNLVTKLLQQNIIEYLPTMPTDV